MLRGLRSLASAAVSHVRHNRTWAVLGAQWGDEGKGKLVDILATDLNFDIVARCAGGSNAGHTVVVDGKRFAFHLLPSGMLNPKTTCVLGNGVVVHLPTLFKELNDLDAKGVDFTDRLKLSDRAHIVFDFHQVVDSVQESGGTKIGTTLRGIGPAYSSKATRNGVRIGDLLHWDTFEAKVTGLFTALQRQYGFEHNLAEELRKLRGLAERVRPLVTDTVAYLHAARQSGRSLLVEGANACLLDVDFGSYPFVTSSSTTIGGACTGLGIPPQVIGKTIGVAKAYLTRVGGGPFPTELTDKIGEGMRARGKEFGVTTGRPRRCGWFDVVAMRYSHMINGYSSLNITKLDVLSDLEEIKVAVGYKYKGEPLTTFPASLQVLEQVEVVYETLPGWGVDISHARSFADLPPNAQAYIQRLEELVRVPISAVGVGPGREAMIKLKEY